MLTTLVMTDIEGSTAMWDDAAHLMVEVLAQHDALIAETVRAHGGRVVQEKAEGDSTFSVFRAPLPALRAAVDIQRRLLSHTWPHGLPVRVRIGVHAGDSTELHDRYYGQVVNRCARIRNVGHGGQVLVSASVVELLDEPLGADLELVDVGFFSIRGVREPEHVFQLGHADLPQHFPPLRVQGDRRLPPEAAGHGDAPEAPLLVPLARPLQAGSAVVGRAAPLRVLTEAWARAAGGEHAAVLVCGEPGVGKTALAGALARYAYAGDALVLYGRCDEDLPVPYQPFVEALWALSAAAGEQTLQTWLGHRLPDLARLLPELQDLTGQVVDATPADPDAGRWCMFEAVTRTLAAAAREQPLLLVLDDLHWAAGPTLQLLRHLLRSQRSMRLLVVGTYRDTEVRPDHPLAELLADLQREGLAERLPLRGLDEDGVVAMLELAAGPDRGRIQRDLAAAVHGQTAGNPFFVGEVRRFLADTGALVGRGGRWTADDLLEQTPSGVREMVARRLAHLSGQAGGVLTAAAVAGASFDVSVLQRVTSLDDDTLLDALEEAVAAGLLVDEASRFAFAHAIVRQAVLDEVTGARRIRLHARTAAGLEAVTPDDVDALAHHFAASAAVAGSTKAADYALAAARRACERAAFEDARAVLVRALQALEADPSADPARRCDVRLELAAVRRVLLGRGCERELVLAAADDARMLGSAERLAWAALLAYPGGVADPWPPVASLYEDALALLGEGDPVLRSHVLGCLAEYLFDCLGRREEASVVARQSVELARRTASRSLLTARLAGLAHIVRAGRDPAECSAVLHELAQLTAADDAAPDDEPLAGRRFSWVRIGTARSGTGAVQSGYLFPLDHGDLQGFEQFLTERREVADRTGGWASRYDALTAAMSLAALRGRWDAALQRAEEVLAHGPTDSDAVNVWGAGRCVVLRDTGRYDELLPLLEAAAGSGIAAFRATWGLALAETGRDEQARQILDELTGPQAARLPVDQTWEVLVALLTELAARLGRADVVAALEADLAPLAGRIVGASAILVCLGAADRYRAIAAAQLGCVGQADALFEAALRLEERVGGTPLATRTRLWHGRMLLEHGDLEQARRVLGRALADARSLGMATVAGELELLLTSDEQVLPTAPG